MQAPVIVVAGASGELGGRIVKALLTRQAVVRALVRPQAATSKTTPLEQAGALLTPCDFNDLPALRASCADASCVVSALSGVREVIVTAQTNLLDASIAGGVPRFIPSDFCIDYARITPGTNRNLDLRCEFNARLDQAPIRATSVLNGMFSELLVDKAPFILFRWQRVLYFGSADQPLDFTSMDDVASFTAEAALDPLAPRYLRIAGDRLTARGLLHAAHNATGKTFHLLRGGSVGMLDWLAKITRVFVPGARQAFPPWQGMQYMRDMFSGRGLLVPLDNDRYGVRPWTSVESLLRGR